jgi:hypothetical protein
MDLSVGGIFLDIILPPPPGSLVSLKFRLVGYEDPITVTGEVTYSQEGMGMGIKFLNLKPEDKKKIETVIEKLK